MEFFDWTNVAQIFTDFIFGMVLSGASAEGMGIGEIVSIQLLAQYIALGISGALFLACLVLGGVGMHVMAKRAGIKGSVMAFFPFANTWFAGKLAGETKLFGKTMKRPGLWAMLCEIAFVAIGVFLQVCTFALLRPEYYSEAYIDGAMAGWQLDTAKIPLGLRWMATANLVCSILNYVVYIALAFFMCVLFYAFFRKYYPRSPFLMTFLSVILPLRGIMIFVMRKNEPVDYNAWVRRRMQEAIRRQQAAYGPYGQYGAPWQGTSGPAQGGSGQYRDPYAAPPQQEPSAPNDENPFPEFGGKDEPFSDFGDSGGAGDGKGGR